MRVRTNDGTRCATQRDPSRLSEDLPSETKRPRSSCAGTTDTDRFAEYKSASRGKFGRSTSACRIENKTEQNGSARFPFVRPFEPSAAAPNNTRASTEDAIELAVDSGGFVLSDHRAAFDAVTRHDKAGVQFLDGPGRREAAGWQSNGSDILM
jgi:hypothetical protein